MHEGDKGVKLSEDKKKRVAVASSLRKNYTDIIFEEVTSALIH